MKPPLTFLLSLTFLFLFLIATPVLAEELYLKCDGTRFAGKFWTNTTFVKIYPEKGQALLQDQMEKNNNSNLWEMLKIIRFEKEFIKLSHSTSSDSFYTIDRITGRMQSGTILTTKKGNKEFYGIAFWLCSKVKASF